MKRLRYRQIVLLLAVLVLPALVIAVQGRRLVDLARTQAEAQAEDQAEKRRTERQKRMAAEIGQELYATLEAIKGQEMTNTGSAITLPAEYSDEAVVLAGYLDGDRLSWPWDATPAPPVRSDAMDEPEFDRMLRQAERAEFGDQDYPRATDLYRDSIEIAQTEGNRAVARFGLARALTKGGASDDEVTDVYREILRLPWNIVDDAPSASSFARSAAEILIDRTGGGEVLERLKRDTDSGDLANRIDLLQSLIRDLQASEDPEVREESAALSAWVKQLEMARGMPEAQELQRVFPSLGVTSREWKTYVGPAGALRLISKAPASPLVLLVDGEAVRRRVEEDRLARGEPATFGITADEDGESLGGSFPNLRVTFDSVEEPLEVAASGLESFYGLSLFVVVPLTFLGGYLLWRDTRREIHIAELRSQFVASVSHELKTPLTSIRLFAEALQMGLAKPEIHAEYLETIVNESERLTRLLNNVLDFSRIERGQKTYRMEPGSLSEVAHGAARTMRYPLEEQGFNLDLDIREELPPVEFDRDAIHQAILNLLANAMKYSASSRGIGLRVSTENGTAVIQVSDHGIGIPLKDQPHIFEEFYRAPVPENRAVSGTGLGLALVAHIAQAHGGSVDVHSKPGEGSIFSIRLPFEPSSLR